MSDLVVAAPRASHGGLFASRPRVIIEHGLEAPARAGMVESLARGYLQNERVSIHALAGPDRVIRMVPLNTIAWHCGNGNKLSIGIEHTGYASWVNEWLTGDSRQGQVSGAFDALRNGARVTAEIALELGIPRRWLSIAQMRAGEAGIATHNDARLAWGGTTHYDLGPGFDKVAAAIYMRMVRQYAGDDAVLQDNPNPAPTGTTGGAEPERSLMLTFFTYPQVEPRADGKYDARVFLSNGVDFRHIRTMDELRDVIYNQRALGGQLQYVTDGKLAVAPVPTGDPAAAAITVATAPMVANPYIFGEDIADPRRSGN